MKIRSAFLALLLAYSFPVYAGKHDGASHRPMDINSEAIRIETEKIKIYMDTDRKGPKSDAENFQALLMKVFLGLALQEKQAEIENPIVSQVIQKVIFEQAENNNIFSYLKDIRLLTPEEMGKNIINPDDGLTYCIKNEDGTYEEVSSIIWDKSAPICISATWAGHNPHSISSWVATIANDVVEKFEPLSDKNGSEAVQDYIAIHYEKLIDKADRHLAVSFINLSGCTSSIDAKISFTQEETGRRSFMNWGHVLSVSPSGDLNSMQTLSSSENNITHNLRPLLNTNQEYYIHLRLLSPYDKRNIHFEVSACGETVVAFNYKNSYQDTYSENATFREYLREGDIISLTATQKVYLYTDYISEWFQNSRETLFSD